MLIQFRRRTPIWGLVDCRGTIYPGFNLFQWLGLSRPKSFDFNAAEKKQIVSGQSISLLEERNMPFGMIVGGVARMAMLEESLTVPGKANRVDSRYERDCR
jgi:chemotaxis signal transduction protein